MPTPDNDIASRLQTAGVGTVGTNIFRGGMRPPSGVIPHAAVFVRPTGGVGPLPEPFPPGGLPQGLPPPCLKLSDIMAIYIMSLY